MEAAEVVRMNLRPQAASMLLFVLLWPCPIETWLIHPMKVPLVVVGPLALRSCRHHNKDLEHRNSAAAASYIAGADDLQVDRSLGSR